MYTLSKMDVDSVPENVETFKGSTDIEKWVRKFIEVIYCMTTKYE